MNNWYEERKKAGLCTRCKKLIESGKTLCGGCMESNRTAERLRRRRYLADGVCVNCGRVRSPRSKLRCDVCLKRAREEAYSRKAAGLCRTCPRPATSKGGTFCASCLATINKRRAARKALGICLECGRQRLADSSRCEEHYLKSVSRRTLEDRSRWEEIKILFIKQDARCVYTGIELKLGTNAELDHKYPRDRGGTHATENLQWVYGPVNEMKSNRTDEEFVAIVKKIYQHQKRKKKIGKLSQLSLLKLA